MLPEDYKISVVIPVYKSEESLRPLILRLFSTLEKIGQDYEIILVDDCSPDQSWKILKQLKVEYAHVLKIVNLAKNCGQHNAILCGFSLVTGDIIISMDDDLQNPPEEISKLIEAIKQGYDLAIGAYDYKKHTALRNISGEIIDKIQRKIFHLPKNFQLTSFRGIKRSLVDATVGMNNVFPYLTAMLLSNTSKYTNVNVRHEPRAFGISNYNLKKSLLLAANLIFNYSSYPLYLVAVICFAAFLTAIIIGTVTTYRALMLDIAVPGWASMIVIMSFFNGLILLALLIFGLYLLRINQQFTQARKTYIIGELHE